MSTVKEKAQLVIEKEGERPARLRGLGRPATELQVPDTVRRLITDPLSFTGLVILSFFIFVALAAPYLAPPEFPHEPYRMPRDGYRTEPQPPCEEHPFGTTEGQYDIYYGVVWGTRTAFKVGIIITGVTLMIGLIIGTLAAYYGGWVDEILMRVVETFQAFPFLLAAITMAAVLRSKAPQLQGIYTGMIAIIAFAWTTYARLIRGDILSIKEREYVMAARIVGASDMRIMLRHILLNAIYPTLVVASMDVGSYVLTFSALSFLGLGAEFGYADWGQMLSFARNWIPVLGRYWYIITYPGMAILLFVLGWNLIGDAFRDILDPKLRRAPH
jgi:peptide/nickel transport system permease protein